MTLILTSSGIASSMDAVASKKYGEADRCDCRLSGRAVCGGNEFNERGEEQLIDYYIYGQKSRRLMIAMFISVSVSSE